VDWQYGTVSFTRKKTTVPVIDPLERGTAGSVQRPVLRRAIVRVCVRVHVRDWATEFGQRCRQLDIISVTLHRYS